MAWRRRFKRRRSSRGFRRRRRFSKKHRRTLRKVARKVRFISRTIEVKYDYGGIAADTEIVAGGTLIMPFTINMGADEGQRIGKKIYVKYTDYYFLIGAKSGNNVKQWFRIDFWIQKKCETTGGSFPVPSDMYVAGADGNWPWALTKYSTRFDFKHVKRIMSWVDPTTVWCSQRTYKIRVHWKCMTHYIGTGENYSDFLYNAPFIVATSQYPTTQCPTFKYLSQKTRYIDC